MTSSSRLRYLEQRIQHTKEQLLAVGEMRPGSLSRQYNTCGKPGCKCKDPQNPQRHGPYYQLSYVHRGKSTTQFIRPQFLPEVRQQLAQYQRFKKLTEQWVQLALEQARLKMSLASG